MESMTRRLGAAEDENLKLRQALREAQLRAARTPFMAIPVWRKVDGGLEAIGSLSIVADGEYTTQSLRMLHEMLALYLSNAEPESRAVSPQTQRDDPHK